MEAFSTAQALASNFTLLAAAPLSVGIVGQGTSDDGAVVLTSAHATLDTDRLAYPFFIPEFTGAAACLQDTVLVAGAASACLAPGVVVGTRTPTPAPTMSVASGTISCGSAVAGDTTGATHVVGRVSGEHHYRLTVPHAREYTFETCEGSSFDTFLWLYAGDHLQASSTVIARNDDACDLQSRITRRLAAGEYTLIVEGYGSNTGSYMLSITCGDKEPTAAPTPTPTSFGHHPGGSTMTLSAPRDIGATGPSATIAFVLMSFSAFADIAGSTVMSATVGGVAHNTPFGNAAARMQFNLTAAAGDQVQAVDPCVYLDEEGDIGWRPTGCVHLGTDGSVVMCECNHLTSFAVLTDANRATGAGGGLSEGEQHTLTWFVFVCVGISIGCLTIVILVYAVSSELRTQAKVILLHLCIVYNLALILFLATATNEFDGDVCTGVGAALHFALLSTFLWMLAEGHHLHQTFVNVFSQRRAQEGRELAVYCSVAYGGPAVEVMLLLFLWPAAYERDDGICFLSKGKGAIWFFLGPALAVIALNVYVLVQVSREVWGLGVLNRSDSQTTEIIAKAKRAFKSSLAFGSILGITWVFGLLSLVVPSSVAFHYTFAVCNALGGLWILGFHLLMDPEVGKKVRMSSLGAMLGSDNGKKKPKKHHVVVIRRKKGSVKFNGSWSGTGTGTDRSVSSEGAPQRGSVASAETAETILKAPSSPSSPSFPDPPNGSNEYVESNPAARRPSGDRPAPGLSLKLLSSPHLGLVDNPALQSNPIIQVPLAGDPPNSGKPVTDGTYLDVSPRGRPGDEEMRSYSAGSFITEEPDDHSGGSAPEESNYSRGLAPEVTEYSVVSPVGAAPDGPTNGVATSSLGENTLTNATFAIADADPVGIGAWMGP